MQTVREYLKSEGFTHSKTFYTEIGEDGDCYWQNKKGDKWKSIKLSKEIAEKAFQSKDSMMTFLDTPITNFNLSNNKLISLR